MHGDNFFVTGNFRPIKDEDEDKVSLAALNFLASVFLSDYKQNDNR